MIATNLFTLLQKAALILVRLAELVDIKKKLKHLRKEENHDQKSD